MIGSFIERGSEYSRKSVVWLGLWLLLCALPSVANAQQEPVAQTGSGSATASNLTELPLQGQQSGVQAPASISGRVIDQSGAAIGGAEVTLAGVGETQSRQVTTDDDGQFSFAGVPPGTVQLKIESAGLVLQVLYQTLNPGQACVIPDVTLVVATQVTEVRVGVTPAELAEDEVKEQEKQRIFGVIPNFFVTYESRPVPLNARLKFELAWKSASDPFTLAAVGAVAGIEQGTNQWKGYGQGVEGYAKRYGATYADVFAGTYIGSAVLPTVFRQDPRYYYKGTGSKRSRLLHALAGSVICKGDNGKTELNYSNIGGGFATGALANLYYPASQRNGTNVVVSTALIRIGETAVANVFQEFFIPKATRNLPSRSTNQP